MQNQLGFARGAPPAQICTKSWAPLTFDGGVPTCPPYSGAVEGATSSFYFSVRRATHSKAAPVVDVAAPSRQFRVASPPPPPSLPFAPVRPRGPPKESFSICSLFYLSSFVQFSFVFDTCFLICHFVGTCFPLCVGPQEIHFYLFKASFPNSFYLSEVFFLMKQRPRRLRGPPARHHTK